MFSRYIDNIDFKSRFRILKGGKISLIISAMLIGTVTVANATPSPVTITGSTAYNQTITEDSSFIIEDLVVEDISAFQVDANNNNIISINGSNISAMGEDDSQAINGIYIYNLASYGEDNDYKKITINLDSLNVENESGNAYGFSKADIGSDASNPSSIIMNISNSIQKDYGIKVSGVGYVNGMFLNNLLIDSEITNNGNIIVSNANDDNTKAYGIEMFVRGDNTTSLDNSTIINNGTFEISSNEEAHGIYLHGTMEDSEISNTGSMNITTTTNSEETFSYGIYSRDYMNNSEINNEGDLIVKATTTFNGEDDTGIHTKATGIYIDYLNGSSLINNTGKIEVMAQIDTNSDVYAYAYANGIVVDIDDLDINDNYVPKIINTGTITANVIVSPSVTRGGIESTGVDVDHYSDSDFVLENTGTIEATINNKLDKNGYALDIDSYEYSTKVKTINSGTLRGNIEVDGLLENSGTIELAYNAIGDDSAYIQNFINKEDGKLTIGLKTDGTLEGTEYSHLNTERAIFENGSTLDVNVLKNSTNQLLLAGKRLEDVIYADTELTINGKLNVTDNSALLNFEYKTSDDWINGEDGAIHLSIVKAKDENGKDITIETATKAAGGNQSTQAASRILNNVSNNLASYPAMTSVINAFNGLQTQAQIAQAVESTTSLTPTATVGATTQIANGIAGIVTQRQNANLGGGLNSGDTMFVDKNFWFKPFGSIGSQNNKDGINGFDIKAQGFGLGLDGEYKDNQNIGFGLFYTSANIDINNVSQETDLDVFTTLIYGNIPVIDDKTNFLYQVGYSLQKTEGKREIFTGQTATSDYTSKTASVDLKLMRDLQVTDDLLLQPMVETTYRHFTNPSYKENGAGSLNLNMDKFTSSDLIIGIGTLAHYKLTEDSKIVGNLNVGYDLHGKNQTVTSAFEGATGLKFDTEGIDNGKWNYLAGIGYEKELDKSNSFNILYDYQAQGSDFSNNTISAKYVLKF